MSKAVEARMAEYEGARPGAALLVLAAGRPLVRRGYGLADIESGAATSPATNYRLASVTKQFTAAAVLLLSQAGRLALDDRVRRWLPSLPPAAEAMTLRHLLTHTSGLLDYEELIPEGTTEQLRDADVLRLLERQERVEFTPGTRYRYSNSGYALLALVVERAADVSFATYLREQIFLPLGMSDTAAVEDHASIPHRAFGHSHLNGAWQRSDQSLTSAVLGDGGVYSSISDLEKWDAALYEPRFQAAFAPATATDDPNVEYGFGWRISRHRGQRLQWHSGETIGFRNVLLRFPESRLTVILLTNRNDPEPHPLALALADLYL